MRAGERGVSLVELVIGIAITTMILGTIGATLVATVRTTTAGHNQQRATEQLRDGLFWLNQDTQSGVASLASVADGDVTMQWTDYSTGASYSSRYQQTGADLTRTLTVNGVSTVRSVATDLVGGGFTASQSGNSVTYTLTVTNGAATQSRTETATMRVTDIPLTPFSTVTAVPTATNTPTATVTDTPTATPTSSCNGLNGGYYNNIDLTALTVTRVDATVNFDWGTGSPDASIGADTFSVRWTGQVVPLYSETYRFYTTSDDGVRLWVNGQQIVNNWTDHAATENSGTIALTAGAQYDVKMEYFENGGNAVAKLWWSSASQVKQAIPQTQLCPGPLAPSPTPFPVGTGTGFEGNYYDNIDFTAPKLLRNDATIDFDWGSGSPDASMGADTFSVRWTGFVQPRYSATYTFSTTSDDGVRLWVNNVLLIDNWTDHAATVNSGTMTLAAGVMYDFKMEFYENTGQAVAKLRWSNYYLPEEVIPTSQLYPPPPATPTATPTDTSTATPTNTSTATPTSTATYTPTPTPTNTAVPTATNTSTVTSTSTPTATSTSTPTAWLQNGSYTGDGDAGHTISGLAFQPDIIVIRSSGATEAVVWTSAMPSGRAKNITTAGGLQTQRIQSVGASSFDVGSDASVNSSGTTYNWTAMSAGANVAVGSYTGNGNDNRNLDVVGFQPEWLMTIADGQEDYFRPSPVSGDASFLIDGTSTSANLIQAIRPLGFQAGSSSGVNESGRAYYWIAFEAGAKVVVNSYTGNGTDNRNITGLGIDPEFVWVKRSSSSQAVWSNNALPADRSAYWGALAAVSNRIQALISGGFQVGNASEVNNNGSTYYYLALTP